MGTLLCSLSLTDTVKATMRRKLGHILAQCLFTVALTVDVANAVLYYFGGSQILFEINAGLANISATCILISTSLYHAAKSRLEDD